MKSTTHAVNSEHVALASTVQTESWTRDWPLSKRMLQHKITVGCLCHIKVWHGLAKRTGNVIKAILDHRSPSEGGWPHRTTRTSGQNAGKKKITFCMWTALRIRVYEMRWIGFKIPNSSLQQLLELFYTCSEHRTASGYSFTETILSFSP